MNCDEVVNQAVKAFYEQCDAACVWVAYSGGLDSTVLLDALAAQSTAKKPIKAIHVHHGLQADADQWVHHCEAQCERLGVELSVVRVAIHGLDNLESKARQARYQAFEQTVSVGEVICTAHHQRDQAETLCLNLMRGTGVNGLAGMPIRRRLSSHHQAWLIRPLLSVSYDCLKQYAHDRALTWVEDATNHDIRFQRNAIRHQWLPMMTKTWPQAEAKLAQTAMHLAEARDLLEQLAAEDLTQVEHNAMRIDWTALQHFDWSRQKLILRYWLHHFHGVSLDQSTLEWLRMDCFHAASQAQPQRLLKRGKLRRYQRFIYYLPHQPKSYRFLIQECTALADYGVVTQFTQGQGMALAWFNSPHKVYLRNLSDADSFNRRSLKKWFQSQGVPPWQRPYWPVIEIDGELAAIVEYAVIDKFKARNEQASYKFVGLFEAERLLG